MAGRHRLNGGSNRLLAAAAAFVVLLAQAGTVAAAATWTVTAKPQTIVGGSSDTVRLTIQNTSSSNGSGSSGNISIGCVKVAVPSTFSVGTPSVVSVSNGLSWSASRSGQTVTAKGASSGDRLREDPDNDILVLDVPVSAGLVALGPWTITAYEKINCTNKTFPIETILITIIVSPKPTPKPTPPPTPQPTPRPTPTAAPTPRPTSAATAPPTADPSPADRPVDSPAPSAKPSSAATPVATATPGIGLGGPTSTSGPPRGGVTTPGNTAGEPFVGGISIPVKEDDPSFPHLGLDLLASLGAFSWAVPGALLAAPGLLLIVIILAQSMGALAWLPVVRRKIGNFGLAPRLTPPRGPA